MDVLANDSNKIEIYYNYVFWLTNVYGYLFDYTKYNSSFLSDINLLIRESLANGVDLFKVRKIMDERVSICGIYSLIRFLKYALKQ